MRRAAVVRALATTWPCPLHRDRVTLVRTHAHTIDSFPLNGRTSARAVLVCTENRSRSPLCVPCRHTHTSCPSPRRAAACSSSWSRFVDFLKDYETYHAAEDMLNKLAKMVPEDATVEASREAWEKLSPPPVPEGPFSSAGQDIVMQMIHGLGYVVRVRSQSTLLNTHTHTHTRTKIHTCLLTSAHTHTHTQPHKSTFTNTQVAYNWPR